MKHCCGLPVLKLNSVTVMASEVGYTSSAISYSHGVPRQTDLKEAKYVRQLPMNSITDVTTIMFAIPPMDDFIDLQESYMVVKVKVLKANGTQLVDDDAVALSDNVLGTLFKSVSVYLNGVKKKLECIPSHRKLLCDTLWRGKRCNKNSCTSFTRPNR